MGSRISVITPWCGSTAHLVADYDDAVRGFDEVIVIDNASDEETADSLCLLAGCSGWAYIRNNHNAGFSAANNQGYQRATGDIILFANSDIMAPVRGLDDAVRKDVKDGALYGPSLGQQCVWGMQFGYVEGWCIAATRATWDRLITGSNVGPWDAVSYPRFYWEDNDLGLRALLADFGLVQTPWTKQRMLVHKGGQSTGPAVRHGDIYEQGRATFAARARVAWEETVKEGGR